MPETTPKIKIDAVKSRGGEVVLKGVSYNDAYDYAMELAEKGKTDLYCAVLMILM